MYKALVGLPNMCKPMHGKSDYDVDNDESALQAQISWKLKISENTFCAEYH